MGFGQRMKIIFKGSSKKDIVVEVASPRGINPLLSVEEIAEKWETLTKDVVDVDRRKKIEHFVLALDKNGGNTSTLDVVIDLLSTPMKGLEGF